MEPVTNCSEGATSCGAESPRPARPGDFPGHYRNFVLPGSLPQEAFESRPNEGRTASVAFRMRASHAYSQRPCAIHRGSALRRGMIPHRVPPLPLLEKDEVHIWRGVIDLPESRIHAFEEALTPDECARADGFRFKTSRDRFVAARGLLRAILGRYLGTHPGQLRFRYGPYGKPALDGETGKNIRFNLSHANGLALYALARDRELGIDLEQVRPHSLDQTIAEQYFSDQENAMLGVSSLHGGPEPFFRYWTRREAYLKARGEGLSGLSRRPDFSLEGGDPLPLGMTEETNQRGVQWLLRDLDPAPGYVAAIAIEGPSSRLRLMFAEWPPK
jgi:4'-phosphopantetheinyl transferase